MFYPQSTSQKEEFLEQAKAARLERAHEKKRDNAATCIQAHVRGFLTRKRVKSSIQEELQQFLKEFESKNEQPKLIPAIQVFKVIRKFKLVFKEKQDKQKFERLCRYLIASMECPDQKYCYISVALNKAYAVPWIGQVQAILSQCCFYLGNLKLEIPQDSSSLMLYLHVLVTFTSLNTWSMLKGAPGEALRPVFEQLCQKLLVHLVGEGLYIHLQGILLKGLLRSKPLLKHAPLLAITQLALRPVSQREPSESLLNLFMLHIFSVPAFIHHLNTAAPECVSLMKKHCILQNMMNVLEKEQSARILFNALECNYSLCLFANLVHLAYFDTHALSMNQGKFIWASSKLLESCQKYVVSKQSNLTQWHPILGWFAQGVDHQLHACLGLVKRQLQHLWSGPLIKALFIRLNPMVSPTSPTSTEAQSPTRADTALNCQSFQLEELVCSCLLDLYCYVPISTVDANTHAPEAIFSSRPNAVTCLIRKTLERTLSGKSGSSLSGAATKGRRFSPEEIKETSQACQMYETAINTLTQMRLDILTGLCSQSLVLINLWSFLCWWGSHQKDFLDQLTSEPASPPQEFYILLLFCQCATHLITILDDLEMYEQQKPFALEDIVIMSTFLNHLVFRLIWNGLLDVKPVNKLFVAAHTLLMLLYKRDCRRSYTTPDHWLIKEVRASSLLHDLEKNKKVAQILMQKIPHLIPHKERVVLFRKYVTNEKAALGLTESACSSPQSTLLTVHRARIVEDGYQQLALLPPQALKGIIRVKFINEQGLDEAGIDQDGVFKEFLEESIKKVFDPSLNLFKVTSEERLYPSYTSYIHENHLSLFEFVGKLLGKAIYEGIVIDVPFASFFLSQVLGHQQSALYSSIDELPSLDKDLYKSLTYIKHYEGDVQELDLTFSLDEDCMGQLITHELIPGGKAIPVTNDNRISYMHLMAHFRMHVQIRDQTQAFLRGFRSIVCPEWLTMFSAPELQRLISGDNNPIDIQDLRRHTKYFGGFHGSHRVIKWLWELLERDFTPQEHRLFLKFVTSCSKPPLLGFAHLEPPFSIRCVEVSDDQDTGDTVGSVLRGFLTIHKRDPVNRLPTSSTCFNLLKLPNYQKRSTLRDKLRYAITSNTGFELS